MRKNETMETPTATSSTTRNPGPSSSSLSLPPPKKKPNWTMYDAIVAKKPASVMTSTSRLMTCVSSWARTPSSSAGDRSSMIPVVAQTVADFCERPIANAFGIAVCMTATFGLGRSAWMQRRSIIAWSSGASCGVTSRAPTARNASLSDAKTCTAKIAAMRKIATPAFAARATATSTTYTRPSRSIVTSMRAWRPGSRPKDVERGMDEILPGGSTADASIARRDEDSPADRGCGAPARALGGPAAGVGRGFAAEPPERHPEEDPGHAGAHRPAQGDRTRPHEPDQRLQPADRLSPGADRAPRAPPGGRPGRPRPQAVGAHEAPGAAARRAPPAPAAAQAAGRGAGRGGPASPRAPTR